LTNDVRHKRRLAKRRLAKRRFAKRRSDERLLSFTTSSRDGDARAPGALSRILRSRRLPIRAASAEQVHGVQIRIVPKLASAKTFPGADGLLTDVPGQPLAIFTADCVPLFLSAGEGRVVGLLHAGWRGVRGNILARAARLIWKRWRLPASTIRAWPGPSIGPCCFEVQWDVARCFPVSRRRRDARWTVDLARELQIQARRLGIQWTSKKPCEECTMHESRYYSYRRNRTAERQVSVIMKKLPWHP